MTQKNPLNIAIVGATGVVGRTCLEILDERNLPIDRLRLMASARSVGKSLEWQGVEIVIEDAAEADYSGVDYAIFSAGAAVSREIAPKAVADGAIVIDNSSAWRMDESIPLVIPEINPHALKEIPKGIVANPNCTTMVALMAIKPLHDAAGLKRLTASTYQAVSGAGISGIDELEKQITDRTLQTHEIFPSVVGLNVLPECGDYLDDDSGETVEELKFRNETRKIMELQDLPVSVTCVRVGVVTGHSMSVNAEFEKPLSPREAEDLLAAAPGVVHDNLPNPRDIEGQDDVKAGRFRRDPGCENGLAFFVSGDNLRKGAALNTIQIVEALAQGV